MSFGQLPKDNFRKEKEVRTLFTLIVMLLATMTSATVSTGIALGANAVETCDLRMKPKTLFQGLRLFIPPGGKFMMLAYDDGRIRCTSPVKIRLVFSGVDIESIRKGPELKGATTQAVLLTMDSKILRDGTPISLGEIVTSSFFGGLARELKRTWRTRDSQTEFLGKIEGIEYSISRKRSIRILIRVNIEDVKKLPSQRTA